MVIDIGLGYAHLQDNMPAQVRLVWKALLPAFHPNLYKTMSACSYICYKHWIVSQMLCQILPELQVHFGRILQHVT